MPYENSDPERLFDTSHIGASIREPLPINGHWLSGLISGDNNSFRKGHGEERDGTRLLQDGDDARLIDHRASSRMTDGSIIVRERYADITPTLYVVTDVFRSRSSINPGICSEQLLGASVIAGLLRTADSEGIPTSLVAASDRSLYVQELADMGLPHLLRTGQDIATLIDTDQPMSISSTRRHGREGRIEKPRLGKDEKLKLADVIKRAGRLILAKESMIVLVSDFRDDLEPRDVSGGWFSQARRLQEAGSVLLAVELTNADDFQLPEKDATLKVEDTKSWIGSGKRDKLSQTRRDLYAKKTALQQVEIDALLKRVTLGHIKLSTIPGERPGQWLRDIRTQLRRINKRV
jgi:hypothetical protein